MRVAGGNVPTDQNLQSKGENQHDCQSRKERTRVAVIHNRRGTQRHGSGKRPSADRPFLISMRRCGARRRVYGEGGALCRLGLSTQHAQPDYPCELIFSRRPRAWRRDSRVRWDHRGSSWIAVIAAIAPCVAADGTCAVVCFRVSGSCVFCVYCRRWGVPLIDGGTVRCPDRGQGGALEIILTAARSGGGMVSGSGSVISRGERRSTRKAEELAQAIAFFPPACVRRTALTIKAAAVGRDA